MYVACTRARDHLIALHVREMATRVGLKTVDAFPYLECFPVPQDNDAEYEAAKMGQIGLDIETVTPDGKIVGIDLGAGRDETVAVAMRNPGSGREWLVHGPPRVAEHVKLDPTAKCRECGEGLVGCRCGQDAAVAQ